MPYKYNPTKIEAPSTSLTFPPSPEEGKYNWGSEIPVWMNFYAAPYSTFSGNRTRDYVQQNYKVDIHVPYPQSHFTGNHQQYMSGKYPDLEGLFDKEDYKLKEQEMENSFTQGLGILSYDHIETVLTPGARRSHRFEMNLVAKNGKQAWEANRIARVFQTYMYPIAFTESVLNMGHPPLWSFYATGGPNFEGSKFWDGDPLVSVLQSVDINHNPIRNLPLATPDFIPLAVNIKLVFLELEPAMQYNWAVNGGLISRSERFKQFEKG
jgi:hypothetical protein